MHKREEGPGRTFFILLAIFYTIVLYVCVTHFLWAFIEVAALIRSL